MRRATWITLLAVGAFVLVLVAVLFLCTYVPWLELALPQLFYGR